MKPKQILVLSDTHVGSSYGLLPPNFLDTQGNTHTQNAGQQYLWDIYIRTLDRVQKRPIDLVVVNGDTLDGLPAKTKEQPGTVLSRPEDQCEAAVKVLEEVKNRFPNASWKFVSGTPNHESGFGVSHVAYILLNEKPDVRRTVTLRCGEAVVQFNHEIGFTAGLLKGNSLERAIIENLLAAGDQGWKESDAIIRSHCHYFRYLGRKNKLALVTPCFQLQTDYMSKRSPDANIPDLGAVVLTVDDSLKTYGMCPVTFTEYLYRHPAPEIVDISGSEETVAAEQ